MPGITCSKLQTNISLFVGISISQRAVSLFKFSSVFPPFWTKLKYQARNMKNNFFKNELPLVELSIPYATLQYLVNSSCKSK